MFSWKLEIEYDGSRYAGWQQQKHARTVQGEILRVATPLFSGNIEIGGAGRTDAGVHALRQVAHLRASQPIAPEQLRIKLNSGLPADINILQVKKIAAHFDARRDAISRYYIYQIATRRTAFAKQYVWWIRDHLKLSAMQGAAQQLVGLHDFRSFSEITEGSTLVKVEQIELATSGSLILFRIAASHFLWKMVRRIMGSLVEVGRGNLLISNFVQMLKEENRASAAWTAPPSGLFLERVLYPGDPRPTQLLPAFPIDQQF